MRDLAEEMFVGLRYVRLHCHVVAGFRFVLTVVALVCLVLPALGTPVFAEDSEPLADNEKSVAELEKELAAQQEGLNTYVSGAADTVAPVITLTLADVKRELEGAATESEAQPPLLTVTETFDGIPVFSPAGWIPLGSSALLGVLMFVMAMIITRMIAAKNARYDFIK